MFSGIVEGTCRVMSVEKFGEGKRISVVFPQGVELSSGESVSLNGVCLTVVSFSGNTATFDLSPETISRTNFKFVKVGDELNFERALKVGDRISGHFVLGHVDTLGEVVEVQKLDKFRRISVRIPEEFSKYIVFKGSVALDGISLTVSEKLGNTFKVDIIPETLRRTNIKNWKEGYTPNVEFDIIVKTVRDAVEDILKNSR